MGELEKSQEHSHVLGPGRARPGSFRSGRRDNGTLASTWILVRPIFLVIAATCWILIATYYYVVLVPAVLQTLHYNDFGKFYYSVVAWSEGGSLYQPSVATLIDYGAGVTANLWNMNPPHAHLPLWPLTLLPIGQAFAIWMGGNVVAAAWALRASVRATHIRPPWWVLAVSLVSEPTLAWAITGQLTGFLVAATTALWLSIRREAWTRAGIVLGLACSVKPFLGVFILWLAVTRRWIALAWTGGTFIIAVVAGILVFGFSSYAEWVTVLGDVQWVGAPMNAAVAGVIGRSWTAHALVDSSAPLLIAMPVSVGLVALGVWSAVRAEDSDRAVLILLLTALLASPLGWVYYLWFIVGPALVVWRSLTRRHAVVAGLIGLMVPQIMIWPFDSTLWAVTAGSIYGWSVLMLWAGTIPSHSRHVCANR